MSLQSNIQRYEYTSTSPNGNAHNETGHVLIDNKRHSNIDDARSCRGAVCDIHNYLVVEKVRQGLSVRKRAAQMFVMKRFNLRKLNDVDFKEQLTG
jgi:hypothetical protein